MFIFHSTINAAVRNAVRSVSLDGAVRYAIFVYWFHSG